MLYPETIADSDGDWRKAFAFLQVIPLNPRKKPSSGSLPQTFYETADDYLVRPMIYEGKTKVPAPYYCYVLRLSVALGVIGRIPVEANDQLDVFRRTVNAAIQSEIGLAERRRWVLNDERLKLERAEDPRSTLVLAEQSKSAAIAAAGYDAAFDALLARNGRCPSHEDVLHSILAAAGVLDQDEVRDEQAAVA